jgi:hypothetical protein
MRMSHRQENNLMLRSRLLQKCRLTQPRSAGSPTCTRSPAAYAGAGVVAAKRAARRDGVRTPCRQSGRLRGLRLVPSKWRCLVPGERRDGAQSRPPVRRRGITQSVSLLNNFSMQFVEIKLCCSGTSNPTTSLFPTI